MQPKMENLNLQDLCDFLVVKTAQFLQLLEQRNADGYTLRDLKLEVEKIQELIKQKKMQTSS